MRNALFLSVVVLSTWVSLVHARPSIDRSLPDGEYRIDRVIVGETVIRPSDERVTLMIAGNKVSGFSGCNRFMGDIRYRDGKVVLGPLAGTRMACLQPDLETLETAILSALGHARTLGFAPRQKTVILRGDHGELVSLVYRGATESLVDERSVDKLGKQ